ncbi:unnamed protein product, partial [Dibothriocephalus latus]
MPPAGYPFLGGSLPLTKEAELRSDFRGRGSDPKMPTNAYAHLPDQDSGMGRTTDESVRTAESSEQGFLGSDHGPNEDSGSHSGNQNKASVNIQKKDLLDAELVRLSHLMQSLALHCSNLAYVKQLYSNAVQRDIQEAPLQTTPFPVASR